MTGKPFKVVPGFSQYKVSRDGIVKSIHRKEPLTHFHHRQGYWLVSVIRDDGWRNNICVHRLIALAWLPNPRHYCDVHYKVKDYNNFHADNLYWGASYRRFGPGKSGANNGRFGDRFYNDGKENWVIKQGEVVPPHLVKGRINNGPLAGKQRHSYTMNYWYELNS